MLNKTIETFKQDNVNVINQAQTITLSEEQRAKNTIMEYSDDIASLVFSVSFYNQGYLFYRLGLAFKNGTNGVSKDINKALKYFKKGAGLLHRDCILEMIEIKRLNGSMSAEWYEFFKDSVDDIEDDQAEIKLKIDELLGGVFDDKILADIEEYTNPRLVYGVAKSFEKGLNSFPRAKQFYVRCLLIAAGYFNFDAINELQKIYMGTDDYKKEFLPKKSLWVLLMNIIDFFEL